MKLRAITLALTAVSVLVSAPATATSPQTVDPAGMTPVLNPDYAPWACVLAGTGITCTGYEEVSYTDEPTGFQCDGHDVLATGDLQSKFVRWHDLQGRALKTSIQTNYTSDELTLAGDDDGPVVVSSGAWHKHYVYPVPGDLTQRVLTETGSVNKIRFPGGGVQFRDTGTITYVPDQEYETPSVMHGIHDSYADVDVVALVCAGLTG